MLYNDTVIQDGFAEKGPLQQWVGLHNELFPSKRESKARKALHNSIKLEIDIGIGNLPSNSFSQFFRNTHKEILSLPITSQKNWFETVTKARMQYDRQNLILDGFSKMGFLQRWVGLEHALFI